MDILIRHNCGERKNYVGRAALNHPSANFQASQHSHEAKSLKNELKERY